MDAALLTRVEAKDRPTGVAADILRIGTGRTRDLTALAGLHLDVVDDGADRHALERHGIARLHVGGAERGDHLVAGAETLRRDDVGKLAIGVLDQRDPGGAVRIILEPLDSRRLLEAHATEVDHAVRALVTAATMVRSDATGVVAAARLAETFGQRLDRLALPQLRPIGRDKLTAARGGRIVSF